MSFKSLLVMACLCCAGIQPGWAKQTQQMEEARGWMPARLIGAQERIIHSEQTGRDYRIQVAKIGPPPKAGYPVLYVLDGDAIFPFVALAAQGMGMRAEENHAASLLVVGVGYPNGQLLDLAARAEDYTPPSADYANTGDALSTRFGGAEAFADFLSNRLRPQIARDFHVNPRQQSLFGHSYGGLFSLYLLFNQPQQFRHYLASSPSIWWNDRRVLADFQKFQRLRAENSAQPLSVRLSAGEYEQTMAPYLASNQERQARLNRRAMVTAVNDLAQKLQEMGDSKLDVKSTIHPAQTHATVLAYAVIDALKWVFAQCRADAQCMPSKAGRAITASDAAGSSP